MSKNKKSKKTERGMLDNATRFASRNRTTLGLAGAGLAAAALFFGRRYRDQRDAARWSDDDATSGAAI